MRERRSRLAPALRIGAALVLVSAVGLGTTPRLASAATTGAGFLTATMSLDIFPCYTGGCPGTAGGTAGISLSGLGTAVISGVPVPYSAVWTPTAGNFTSSFTYQDTCDLGQPDGTVPISSRGNGTFSLSGGSGVFDGGTVAGVTLSGKYQFIRLASAVLISLFNLLITPPAGSPVMAVSLTDAIAGQSVVGIVWTDGPGTCGSASNQVSPQTADLAAVALQPA